MKQSTFVKGTFILMAATLLSKILGSIFRIPLQNIAGDEVLGIFSMVYPVYMMTLILSVAGIPIAISQLIAAERVKKSDTSIHDIVMTARILGLLFGMICFLLIILFSSPISQALGGTTTRPALVIVSFTLIIAPFMAVYRGFFQGYEVMEPTAYSQVIEQMLRVVIMLAAAYFLTSYHYTPAWIAAGTMTGSIAGALASLLFLHIMYIKKHCRLPGNHRFTIAAFMKWSRKILETAFPIVIGSITVALFNVIDAFTIPFSLRSTGTQSAESINYLYGIYGRGLTLVQIVTVFSTSITLSLIPLITKKLALKEYGKTKEIIERTHWMTHLLSWPAATGLVALTLPLNVALFTNAAGSHVMAIIGAGSVFTSLTLLGTGILQGMHMAKYAAWIVLSGGLLKVIGNLILTHYSGLEGAAWATLIVYFFLYLMNSRVIYKTLSYAFFSPSMLKMFFAAVVMGAIIGGTAWSIPFETWSRIHVFSFVLLAALIGAIIYFVLLLVFKVSTMKQMKDMFTRGGW